MKKFFISLFLIFCTGCCLILPEQEAVKKIYLTFPNAKIYVLNSNSRQYIIKDGNNYYFAERDGYYNLNISTTYLIKEEK